MPKFKSGDIVIDRHANIVYRICNIYEDRDREPWYKVDILEVASNDMYMVGEENFPCDACEYDEFAYSYLSGKQFDKDLEILLNE